MLRRSPLGSPSVQLRTHPLVRNGEKKSLSPKVRSRKSGTVSPSSQRGSSQVPRPNIGNWCGPIATVYPEFSALYASIASARRYSSSMYSVLNDGNLPSLWLGSDDSGPRPFRPCLGGSTPGQGLEAHNAGLGMDKLWMVSFIRVIIAMLRSGTQGGGTRRVDTLYDLHDTSPYASHIIPSEGRIIW